MLEANRNLNWRDMQHIVVRTAKPDHLIARDWQVNGVGRNGIFTLLYCLHNFCHIKFPRAHSHSCYTSKPFIWLWAHGRGSNGASSTYLENCSSATILRNKGC